MVDREKPRIAILASGSGSTAEAFILAANENIVDAEVGLIVCNNKPDKAKVYERVDRLNRELELDIPVLNISGATHPGRPGNKGEQTLDESAAIAREISLAGCSFVALMGYLKKVRGELLEAYGWLPAKPDKIGMVNSHPAPLPQTVGLIGIHAQELVLAENLGYSAHTVHAVTANYDEGRILRETRVPVLPGDTAQSLFDRVQIVEKKVLPIVIGECLSSGGIINAS